MNEKNKKGPKGKGNPPRAFTLDTSDNPTFSFYASEGLRFCWEFFVNEGKPTNPKSNGNKTANSVKPILRVLLVSNYRQKITENPNI
jgi:hypothetical protein